MWLPIETAPRDFVTEVDLWSNGKRYPECSWTLPDNKRDNQDYCWCYLEYENNWGWVANRVPNPTHWMPLPEPPSEA